jgi:glycosyltransferase involved in cell wall biosynthesis
VRILLVAPEPPHPPRRGNQIYEHHLVRRLSGRHEVHLLCLAEPAAAEEAAGPLRDAFASVRMVPLTATGHLRRAASALARGDWLLNRHDVPALRRALAEAAREGPDVVQVTGIAMARCVDGLGGLPAVAVPYDCQSLLYAREAARSAGRRRLYARAQAIRLRAWERRWLPRHDACVVVSPVDAAEIARVAPSTVVEVIPFGVDLDRFRPGAGPGDGATIVFSGNMEYFPNRSAAVELARGIFPRVRARVPGARLRIVGDVGGSLAAEIREAGVEVVGFTDVVPHLAAAAVCASPLRVGAGFKNKVLEAMAMGKPVVATPLSLEGIDARPGEHLLAADDPDAFADAVVRLLEDPALARRLGERARALAERSYGWEAAAERFEALYARVSARRARRPRAPEAAP